MEGKTLKTFKLSIRIRFKEGILDPEAEAILSALNRLEFSNIKSVACDRVFRLELEADDANQAIALGRKAAHDLLANLVMEDFEVELAS